MCNKQRKTRIAMFEIITINKPHLFGQWKEAINFELWNLQLSYGGNWRQVDVSTIGR
jgi:hypothetical protein